MLPPITASLLTATALLLLLPATTNAECLVNTEFDDFFAGLAGSEIPSENSCCMFDVCGLECPKPVSDPSNGFGIAVMISVIISFLVGVATLFLVHGKSENYFVAGRSLPLWIVSITLAAQSVDSNALLGNADLSYKYSFYDGAVIPIGLGLSLVLNGIFLAHHINNDGVLTLPDVFAKRYGPVVEVLVSLTTIVSFLMLLAGNLVGFAAITSYVWGITETAAVWTAAAIVFSYTVCGGLFSVAYTDVVQGLMGWSGCIIMAFWFIANEDPNAPPPSIGFPGYIYPDNIGDGGICDMYDGVNCTNIEGACCYNETKWCPNGLGNCDTYDRGAYPFGDKRVYSDQMSYFRSLSPFPNAIFWNWATIFILGFGNLAALDFQARCMASKTAKTARLGCIIGGLFTFLIGIPFAYLGAISRVYYGPDSVHGEFETDTCAVQLGLPTCALWLPDKDAFLKLLTHEAPPVLGGWCLIGIIAASMSTADGAILAMGTVAAHNIARQFDTWFPELVTPENLLTVARVTSLPFTVISTCIAAFYRSSDSAAGATGYLLIVAFDVVFATVVVPLFGAFYAKSPSPRAALLSIIGGVITRVTLEFALPKDGLLLLPYKVDEFLDVGPAASTAYPSFIDVPETEHWDPDAEPCVQDYFEDFTGVDSLAAFLVSFIVFVSVQFLEFQMGRALFEFSGSGGYIKDTTSHPKLSKTGEWVQEAGDGASAKDIHDSDDAVEDVGDKESVEEVVDDAKGKEGVEEVIA